MQGVGNDFVLIDGRELENLDWSELAQRMCDRRFGVGADGLLEIDLSALAVVRMRMHNPDGTPDFCGNGLRCVARYVAEKTPGIRDAPGVWPVHLPYDTGIKFEIETSAGLRSVSVIRGRVTVNMGEPKFAPEDIPVLAPGPRVVDYPLDVAGERLTVTVLSTGTTHTIAFVEELPDDDRFFAISPQIETHTLFPKRTSIMWTKVDSKSRLRLRIWERGAGETWGCGTGACAAAVAAALHGYTEEAVNVVSKGGELDIRWVEGKDILMSGPAEYVFEGVWSAG